MRRAKGATRDDGGRHLKSRKNSDARKQRRQIIQKKRTHHFNNVEAQSPLLLLSRRVRGSASVNDDGR